jgi:lysozyme
MSASCIDISHWQGFPDFDKVAATGVVAMIHKATDGTSYVDPNRAKNIINATAAGIACCTYHYLQPGNAPAQMKHYLDVIDPSPGERMVIDYEEDGCTLVDLRGAVQALIDDSRGLKVTVYSGHLLKEQLGNTEDPFLAANTDLWLAQYTTGTPSWPEATYPQWTLWQYSETGTVNGISGAEVDLNRFNGSNDDLVAWINPSAGPGPSPEPDLPVVSIAVTVPNDVVVEISINGLPIEITGED